MIGCLRVADYWRSASHDAVHPRVIVGEMRPYQLKCQKAKEGEDARSGQLTRRVG